jgi:hypothetical protein
MSNVKLLLSAFLGTALIAGAAAQEKKIYRWVDKDGKVQISDQLPPEAVDKARKEYNAKTGSLKNDVKTQLSPAEKAAADQQAKAEAAAMAEADSVAIEITLMVKKESASKEKKEIISSWTLSLTEGFRVIYIFP